MNEQTSLLALKGIGEKTKAVFERAGIRTVGDLLSYYPRAYRTYPPIADTTKGLPGEDLAICGVLERAPQVSYRNGVAVATAYVRDGAGRILARWFGMPYLRNTLKPGVPRVFFGKLANRGRVRSLDQPAVFSPEQYETLMQTMHPLYALTKGLTNQMVEKAVRQALSHAELRAEFLDERTRGTYRLAQYGQALEDIHFPPDGARQAAARNRLAFDEFLLFLLALRRFRDAGEGRESLFPISRSPVTERVIAGLPYALTAAQRRVWEEIQNDLAGPGVMARLVQGDVGSGKTILAFLAMILVAQNGLQGCLMAPTEVLARQHYEGLQELLLNAGLPCSAVLLVGSMTPKEKREAKRRIASGEVSMVLGTHALIQENVSFRNLALVITDEQHRFGVRQRETLGGKGKDPHVLVMSATPIPRTLAVILYGDLQISVLDELPARRLPTKNCVVDVSYRPRAYRFVQKEVEKGHQAYVICPMVEEGEQLGLEDVLSYSARLRGIFPASTQIGCLHGRMRPKEKNAVMERFLRNEIQVLVSTTVVEVGVNVPNATVMVVENAERFGLAQLHQLRGRVGRGESQSYCILISGQPGAPTKKRLEILNQSNDGFWIAEEDLKLRGPGDLLGVRQSGELAFRLADVFADAGVLQQASAAADGILREDPGLSRPEHARLLEKLLVSFDILQYGKIML